MVSFKLMSDHFLRGIPVVNSMKYPLIPCVMACWRSGPCRLPGMTRWHWIFLLTSTSTQYTWCVLFAYLWQKINTSMQSAGKTIEFLVSLFRTLASCDKSDQQTRSLCWYGPSMTLWLLIQVYLDPVSPASYWSPYVLVMKECMRRGLV